VTGLAFARTDQTHASERAFLCRCDLSADETAANSGGDELNKHIEEDSCAGGFFCNCNRSSIV
jgi:hypothetical protein